MRIVEIKDILRENMPMLNCIGKKSDEKNIIISDFKQAVEAVRNIENTNLFKELISSILSVHSIVLAQHTIVVPIEVFSKFHGYLAQLKSKGQSFLDALNEIIPDQDSESISIKLPDETSLSKTGKYLSEIDTILTQILVNEYLKGDIRLCNFDRGSLWIDVFIGSPVALSFFIGIIRFIYECRDRELTLKAKSAVVEDIKLQVEHRKAIREAITKQINDEKERDFNELFIKHNIPEDAHEYRKRVDYHITLLNPLLEKGVQFHPALTASNNADKTLPDPQKLLEIIKQLPETSGE